MLLCDWLLWNVTSLSLCVCVCGGGTKEEVITFIHWFAVKVRCVKVNRLMLVRMTVVRARTDNDPQMPRHIWIPEQPMKQIRYWCCNMLELLHRYQYVIHSFLLHTSYIGLSVCVLCVCLYGLFIFPSICKVLEISYNASEFIWLQRSAAYTYPGRGGIWRDGALHLSSTSPMYVLCVFAGFSGHQKV